MRQVAADRMLPAAGTRTVTWTLNDGSAASTTATTTVSITSINDAPTLAGTAPTASYTEKGSVVTLSPGAAASDCLISRRVRER